MNAIGITFFIISLLAFAFSSSSEKNWTTTKIASLYIAHQEALRDIYNQSESSLYRSLTKAIKQETKEKNGSATKKDPKKTKAKKEIAKISLYSFLQDKKEEHPELYSLTKQVFYRFYPQLHPEFFDHFLDALVKRKQKEEPFALEKVEFPTKEEQKNYYLILKGNLEKNMPSFLDYFSLDPTEIKISLFFVDEKLLTALFNEKAAKKLLFTMHEEEKKPMPSWDTISRICLESYLIINPKWEQLFDLTKTKAAHQKKKKVTGKDQKNSLELEKKIVHPD